MRRLIFVNTLIGWVLVLVLVHMPLLAKAAPVPMDASIKAAPPRAITMGPSCLVYPLTTRQTTVNSATPGDKIDIFEGPGPIDFGWLGWNGLPTTNLDSLYLTNELQYPQMSLNDFYNAHDPSDRMLSVGDWVASLPGVNAVVESSYGLVSALVGREIIIPVWDVFDSGSLVDAYHISSFALVRIDTPTDINLPAHTILATYLGPATVEPCPYLVLTKSGPAIATTNSLITYTLMLTNSGNLTATNLVITDALPVNATYISGGTLTGNNVVSWTVPSMLFGSSLTRTFIVTASQTITNNSYMVRADGDVSASGEVTVTTTINEPNQVYLPVILKN